jgi:hypothetical protein
MFVYISLGVKLFIEMQIFFIVSCLFNCFHSMTVIYSELSLKNNRVCLLEIFFQVKNQHQNWRKYVEVKMSRNQNERKFCNFKSACYICGVHQTENARRRKKTSDPSHSHSLLPLSFLLSLFSFFFSFLSRYCAHIILVHAPVLLCAFLIEEKLSPNFQPRLKICQNLTISCRVLRLEIYILLFSAIVQLFW